LKHAGVVEAASADGENAIAVAPAAASSSGATNIRILGVAVRVGEVIVIGLSFLVTNKFGVNLLAAQPMCQQSAVARLCAQPAQPVVFSLLRIVLTDATSASELVRCVSRAPDLAMQTSAVL
jgi:hypothetical protein